MTTETGMIILVRLAKSCFTGSVTVINIVSVTMKLLETSATHEQCPLSLTAKFLMIKVVTCQQLALSKGLLK